MIKRIISLTYPFVLIILLGFCVYSNSFSGPYIFDDFGFILRNSSLRDLSRIGEIYNIGSLSTRFLTFVTWGLNYHFHEYRVFGYHLTNLLIHIANAFFVFGFVRLILITPRIKEKKSRYFAYPLLVALFFLVHPLQTQAVSYMTQRFALLATFFYIGSLYFYVHARLYDKLRVFKFTLAALLALCGMFTKEITFTLPFMVLFIEIFLFRMKIRRIFFLMGVLFVFALVVPFLWSFNVSDVLLRSYESGSHVGDRVNIGNYYLTQFRVIATYLRLLIFPVGQNLDYDFRVSQSLFRPITTLGGAVLLAFIFVRAFKMKERYPLLAFGIFWFFITITVESSIIPIRNVIFEHRMYLPMIGLAIAVCQLIFILIKNKKVCGFVLVLVVAGLSVLAYQRNKLWQDDLVFWLDVAQKSPQKARVYTHLGNAYFARKNYEQAIANFNKSLELDSNQAGTYTNRGSVYLELGLGDLALKEFTKSLALEPENFATLNNRGSLYTEQKQYELALADFNKALSINVSYAEAYANRGIVYYRNGNMNEAIAEFDKALDLNPSYAKGYFNRGSAYLKLENYEVAIKDLKRSAQLDSSNTQVYNNLGVCYARLKQYDNAIKAFTKGLKVNPHAEDIYQNRGSIYKLQGQADLADKDFAMTKKLKKVGDGL